MIPLPAPHLLVRKINENYYYVVNTWSARSIKIINKIQASILQRIDGKSTVEEIAVALKLNLDSVKIFVKSLADKKIISFDGSATFGPDKFKDKSLNLWIHTTNKCNLSCSYCYINTLQTTGGMPADVRQQLIFKLLETAKEKRLQHINLKLAGGEPLTQFNTWRDFIVDANLAFSDNVCKLSFSFLTNLTIVNQDIIDFAKDNNVLFGISLDGFGEYHDLTRHTWNGRGTFDQVDKNIDELIANGVRLSVSSVITQKNMGGLAALTEYLIDKKVHFRYSIVRGDTIDRAELSRYLKSAYDIMEEAVDNGWQFSKYHRLNDLKPFELGNQTCSSGNSGGAIYVDGSVYYCHVQFGTKFGKNGSIFDKQFDLLDLIEAGSYNEGYRSDDCGSCNYKYICTSGCPMYRVEGKDPNCGLYHEFIPRIFDLQAKERYRLLSENNCARTN